MTTQNQDHNARLRMFQDIGRRTRAGNWVYAIAWPVVYLTTELHDHFPWQGWVLQGLFVVVAILRVYHMRLIKRWLPERELLWLAVLYPIALVSVTAWSAITGLSLLYGSSELVMVMAISLAGFSAGAINNLAPSLVLARAFMACALIPIVAAVLIGSTNAALVLVVLMFLTYLLISSKQQNSEYWLLVTNEYRLREQQLQLETMSRTDALTGLSNRRHFNEKFDEFWRLCQRQHLPLALLMVDIDHFKRINDNYGHSVGDACLAFVSKRLTTAMRRSTDVIARLGGEEFAALLPCTDTAGARIVAENLRKAIAETPFHHGTEGDGGSHDAVITTITVSVGIAVSEPGSCPRQMDLMTAADQALYRSKHEGRNRCSIHGPDQSLDASPPVRVLEVPPPR